MVRNIFGAVLVDVESLKHRAVSPRHDFFISFGVACYRQPTVSFHWFGIISKELEHWLLTSLIQARSTLRHPTTDKLASLLPSADADPTSERWSHLRCVNMLLFHTCLVLKMSCLWTCRAIPCHSLQAHVVLQVIRGVHSFAHKSAASAASLDNVNFQVMIELAARAAWISGPH